MNFWTDFWSVLWFAFWMFAFIAYLMVLFSIIGDIFRDRDLNGWFKALWIIFLVFVPFLTAVIYLIARGNGMAERQARDYKEAQSATESYIRNVAGSSPSDEIAKAKALLDAGSITPAEFDSIKRHALGAHA